jgi:hypothetical protein
LVGGMICARTSNTRIGGLLLALGWSVVVVLAVMAYAALDLPGSYWVPGLLDFVSTPAVPLVVLLLLLFPDGHLLSPRWRPVVWLAVADLVVSVPFSGSALQISDPSGVESVLNWLTSDAHLTFILAAVMLVLGAASMVLRFRRSTGVTHLQLKWLAFAAVITCAAQVAQIVTWNLASFYGPSMAALSFVVLAIGFTAIPVACGVAILHYRLFDIDRVVSRSVAYLAVTVVVLLVYLAVVAALTYLLPAQSSLAVAIATLAAASVLEPTRRRAQHAVDRRFNRSRYDALHTVEDFGGRLAHEIDAATIRSDLLQTVADTLEPSALALFEQRPITFPGDDHAARHRVPVDARVRAPAPG